MSEKHPDNCDPQSQEKTEKDAELVPKDFPYLKRLLAEIDLLKEQKMPQSTNGKSSELKAEPATSTPRRVLGGMARRVR